LVSDHLIRFEEFKVMKKKIANRRQFLRQAAGAAAGAVGFPYVVSSSALGAAGAVAPSERITVGAVGVGPQGSGVMRNFLRQSDAQVVAVCDVKSHVLKAARERVNKHYNSTGCKAYKDFREVMARDDIDVVLAAPPDHWHVLIALAAVKSGKDVYLEKPMGLSLAQDKALRSAVHRNGRVFQFGTQQRSSRNFRFACELALNGRLGRLHTINVWSPGSSQGGDATPVPVPEWLDYERWLGPAPQTPYTKDRCSNKLWWFISDYALGFIAGWGIHPIDIAFWGGGKKVTTPLTIEGKGKWPTKGVCDTAMNWNVVMKYDSGLTMNFTGDPFPEQWRQQDDQSRHGFRRRRRLGPRRPFRNQRASEGVAANRVRVIGHPFAREQQSRTQPARLCQDQGQDGVPYRRCRAGRYTVPH
jgi:predicted dehydrogenase